MSSKFQKLVEKVESPEDVGAMQRVRPYSREQYTEVRYTDGRSDYVIEYDVNYQPELVQRVGTRRMFLRQD